MRLAPCLLLLAACGGGNGTGDGGVPALGETEAAACITATGCGIISDEISLCSTNVAGVSLPYSAQRSGISAATVSCLAAARSDCAAARRCLNGGTTPQPCGGATGTCDRDVLIGCRQLSGPTSPYSTTQTDCSDFGETCVAGSCGLATCMPQLSTCAGDRLQSCDSGILHQLDCTQFSSQCTATGGPHCRGTGDPCAGSLMNPMRGIRCDGSTLVYCFDGQEAKLDCAAAHLACLPNAHGDPFACALGNECTTTGFTSTCAASRLTFCNDGKITTIDCVAAGFKICDTQGLARCK